MTKINYFPTASASVNVESRGLDAMETTIKPPKVILLKILLWNKQPDHFPSLICFVMFLERFLVSFVFSDLARYITKAAGKQIIKKKTAKMQKKKLTPEIITL